MNRIKIVTDSTCDLTSETIKDLEIYVVPLTVIFGNTIYTDGVDITSEQFYPMLEQAKENGYLPKTSQPSAGDFIKVYEKLIDEGYDIISIHLSEGLSGTINSARTAAGALKGNIEIIDAKFLTLGLGFQVIEAAKMAKEGKTIKEIKEKLNIMRSRIEVLFSIDTLEYLQKGGRIGKVSALLGNILNIKPIVRVENGIYVPAGKARSLKQAAIKMVELMEKYLDGAKPIKVGVAHGHAPDIGKYLTKLIEEKYDIAVEIFTQTGPVLGVHTGPGAFGLCFEY